MIYTVAQISDLIGLSKVSIYKRLDLKEIREHISKKQGVTYIDEEGFNLIKASLNLKEEIKSDLKNDNAHNSIDLELSTDKDDTFNLEEEAINLKTDYLNYLKVENEWLKKRIEDQSRQLENFQIMLQSEKQARLQLEAAREEREKKLDTFIGEWQKSRKEKKGFFQKLFK